jgi:hypothetical protein
LGGRAGLFVNGGISRGFVFVEILNELGDGGDFVLARVMC